MIETHLPFRPGPDCDLAEAREVDRLLAAGLLVPLLLDVVVAADAAPSRELRAAALRLVLPDGVVSRGAAVAQEAAAWLWCGGSPPRYVDIAVPPGGGRPHGPHLVVHERRMPAADIASVKALGGAALAVTTPARTAADLLRSLPEPLAQTASAQVMGDAGVAVEEVATCLDAMGRARGVARARRRLRDWPPPVSRDHATSSP